MLESPGDWLVIGVVAFLLFGSKRLPELGKGLGEGLRGFREGLKGAPDPTASAAPTQPVSPDAPQQNAASTPPHSTPVDPK
jgi:sec-independent protein translocase protein TatA